MTLKQALAEIERFMFGRPENEQEAIDVLLAALKKRDELIAEIYEDTEWAMSDGVLDRIEGIDT